VLSELAPPDIFGTFLPNHYRCSLNGPQTSLYLFSRSVVFSLFVRISPQLCTPKFVGVIFKLYTVDNLHKK
jgi:hypothetical protein